MKWIAATLLSTTGLLAYSQTVGQKTETVEIPVPKNFVMYATEVVFSLYPNSPQMRAYEIGVHQNGDGYFRWLGDSAADSKPIRLDEKTVASVDSAFDTVNSSQCETKEKNIAKTGKKTLTYSTGPALSSCHFNYSDHQNVNDVSNTFIAIAETIQLGEKLTQLRRFDRLGLDAEMKTLVDEAASGHAIELQNIATTLQAIIDDDRVIDRVRRSAAKLLADAK